MSAGELLSRLVSALDRAGIPHMVAGSFASTFHGVPRTTQDIDLVVDPTRRGLDSFLAELPETEYYVDSDTARDALERRTQFNVIDKTTGWKVDLIIRKQRPFSEEEFSRRIPAELMGARVFVATAEDTVVAKLEWAALSGGSERQIGDVRGILQVRGDALDRQYVLRWADSLGLGDLWRQVAELQNG